MIVRCPFMQSRTEFGRFCDTFGLRVGVEVGVNRGWFSRKLLEGSEHLFLHCVDPWLPYPDQPGDRSGDQAVALEAVANFCPTRCKVWVAGSPAAVSLIHDPIYFAYIDGDHEGDAPLRDIAAWWAKLRVGGVLAGHDFGYEPVTEAVLKFFKGQTVHVIPEFGGEVGDPEALRPSWWVWKEKP